MNEYLQILGHRVTDKVTGFKGVAATVGFDLYGCVQVIVTPADAGKDTPDSKWFDYSRLIIGESVMEIVPPRSLSIAPSAGGWDKPVR